MMRSGKLQKQLIPTEVEIPEEANILKEVEIHAGGVLGRAIETVQQIE